MYNRLLSSWVHYVIISVLVIVGLYGVTLYVQPTIKETKKYVADYAAKELRVPPYDMVVYLPLYVEDIQRTQFDKPVIGMFGSSTVYGTTVIKGENTSAGVLQSHLPNYQLFNFGLTGARFTETYAVLASVIDQLDIVLIEINYGIVSVSDNQEEILVYPSLFHKLNKQIPIEWVNEYPEKDASTIPSKPHQWLSKHLLSRWSLYHNRDVIMYDWYKKRSAMEKLRTEYDGWVSERIGTKTVKYNIFTGFPKLSDEAQDKIVNHYRHLYQWKQPFDPNDSFGLAMIDQTLQLLSSKGKKAIFYTAPLDYELITKEGLIEWDMYDDIMAEYRKKIESYGYQLFEFNQGKPLIDHQFYHDPSHMVDEGNREFGEILYEVIKGELE